MSETETQETPIEVATDTNEKKRRRLRPGEVDMLRRFLAFMQPGIDVPFNDLPDIEMKRALFPSSQLRLVEKEILTPQYDEDTGMLQSVSIDAEILKYYEYDLTAPDPKIVRTSQRDPDEPKSRRVRGILNNPNYRIFKLATANPKRANSHGWWNWEICYINGQTISEYLSRLDYRRDIIVESKSGKAWFNGPDTIYLYSDFKNGYLGIYDSSKAEGDEGYWIKPAVMDTAETEEEPTETNGEAEDHEAEADGEAQAEAAEAQAAMAKIAETEHPGI